MKCISEIFYEKPKPWFSPAFSTTAWSWGANAPDPLLAGDRPQAVVADTVSDPWECAGPRESLTLAIAMMDSKGVTGNGTFSDGVFDALSACRSLTLTPGEPPLCRCDDTANWNGNRKKYFMVSKQGTLVSLPIPMPCLLFNTLGGTACGFLKQSKSLFISYFCLSREFYLFQLSSFMNPNSFAISGKYLRQKFCRKILNPEMCCM